MCACECCAWSRRGGELGEPRPPTTTGLARRGMAKSINVGAGATRRDDGAQGRAAAPGVVRLGHGIRSQASERAGLRTARLSNSVIVRILSRVTGHGRQGQRAPPGWSYLAPRGRGKQFVAHGGGLEAPPTWAHAAPPTTRIAGSVAPRRAANMHLQTRVEFVSMRSLRLSAVVDMLCETEQEGAAGARNITCRAGRTERWGRIIMFSMCVGLSPSQHTRPGRQGTTSGVRLYSCTVS